jgi:hypothetical protein
MSATSGLVKKDSNFSNLYVSGQLSVQNGPVQQDTAVTRRPNVFNLELNPEEPNPSFLLTPFGSDTLVYTLSGDINSFNIQIDIDDSNSYKGQEMIWMFSNLSENAGSVTIYLSDKFISTAMLAIPNGYKTAQYWVNTGSGWEFTVENC